MLRQVFIEYTFGYPFIYLGGKMNRVLLKYSVTANIGDKLRRGGGVEKLYVVVAFGKSLEYAVYKAHIRKGFLL